MAELCCNIHNLRIETGSRDNTPLEMRYCRVCKNQEVESDFLDKCREFNAQRKKLFEWIEIEVDLFATMSVNNRFYTSSR